MTLSRHLVLVGYRASGKTTVARLLARRLGAPWADTDALVEHSSGQSIPAIFAARGEAGFRALEAQAIDRVLERSEPHVIATGGGCVTIPEVRRQLRAAACAGRALVCYLDVPVADLQQRLLAAVGNRPSLTAGSVVDEVPAMVAQRAPWYREVADVQVDHEATPQAVVEAILLHLDSVEDSGS
jgi:shikimate kinase